VDVSAASDFIRGGILFYIERGNIMKRLTFVKICDNSSENCEIFKSLMLLYAKELDKHQNRQTTKEFLLKWIDGIIKIQGDADRHLELCYDDKTLIGFLYGNIDHPEHKGFIKPGYGYIMEFYVLHQHRRKGYGKEMFLHLEKLFESDGAQRMYLTADPVTGKPFWEQLGFIATGEISHENKLQIYEKQLSTYG